MKYRSYFEYWPTSGWTSKNRTESPTSLELKLSMIYCQHWTPGYFHFNRNFLVFSVIRKSFVQLHVNCNTARSLKFWHVGKPTAEHNFNDVVRTIKATWHVFSSIFHYLLFASVKVKRPEGRILPRQIILYAAQETRLCLVA